MAAPRKGFSTLTLPPERRVERWAEAVSDRFVESGFEVRHPERFDASMLNHDVADLSLTHFSSAGHGRKRVMRSQRAAARAAEEFFLVSLQLEGSCAVLQDGREALLQPGQFAIYDTRRPYELVLNGDYQQAVLRVPRRALATRLPDCDALVATGVSAKALPARVLMQMLREASTGTTELAPAAAQDLSEALLCVLSAGLRGLRDGTAPQAARPGAAQLERIKAYVAAHLHDPGLNVPRIAAALGLSRSYLHQLFRSEGSTLERWIWEQRLAACERTLSDPRHADRSITDIAYGHGFSDAAHFSRSFRRRFGVAPRVHRQGLGLP
ncbi:helix-turn-helix domain-containing protein [uncultured Methylibium sp.]|uniref:AraC-like ligand-binding domain-containing protein n=1 Tax=uncultured Methylibium sp. TaxID=381093 RepID=UPI0025E38606|nr:helix-turn-helix domain-containing protein [uncultured Methylibium sp.]